MPQTQTRPVATGRTCAAAAFQLQATRTTVRRKAPPELDEASPALVVDGHWFVGHEPQAVQRRAPGRPQPQEAARTPGSPSGGLVRVHVCPCLRGVASSRRAGPTPGHRPDLQLFLTSRERPESKTQVRTSGRFLTRPSTWLATKSGTGHSAFTLGQVSTSLETVSLTICITSSTSAPMRTANL